MCSEEMVTSAIREQIAAFQAEHKRVTTSPFGPKDEIGMLNLITGQSRQKIMQRADFGRVYDLAVDYFVGMPGWIAAGDPTYQMWMTHFPAGTKVDNSTNVSPEENELVAYSGDSISMYTHSGTHVDALNHFGYYGEIFNNFSADEHLGSRGWMVGGADKHPPVIARGVLLDVPAWLGVEQLPASYPIGVDELRGTLEKQGTTLNVGDVVLVRTGRMREWPNQDAFMNNSPGLTRPGAEFLAEAGAALIGTDTGSFEQSPAPADGHWNPVHCYMLAEAGIPILEIANLEEIARDEVYEFAFIGACLKLKGATGAPIRPIAVPLTA